jgi:hypothetical protein
LNSIFAVVTALGYACTSTFTSTDSPASTRTFAKSSVAISLSHAVFTLTSVVATLLPSTITLRDNSSNLANCAVTSDVDVAVKLFRYTSFFLAVYFHSKIV